MESSSVIRIAVEALDLVQKGSSENSAVSKVIATDPSLRSYRTRGTGLLLRTITKLDVIDLALHSVLKDQALGQRRRALSRVAALVSLFNPLGSPTLEEVQALRELSPASFQPSLERLVGVLVSTKAERFTESLNEVDRVALETHQRHWWVQYCFRLFGRTDALKLLTSEPRPRYVRLNKLRVSKRTNVSEVARGLGSNLTQLDSLPEVFVFRGAKSVSALTPLFSKGIFQVQDLASYLAIKAADPRAGETVLDLCAAPGAKTSALAQIMKNRGKIVSVDYSASRMRAWTSETSRLGVEIAEPVIEDASNLGIREAFDLVVLDPPCSGTGVLDRNPEMKWHLTPKTIERYSRLQSRMLDEAARVLDGRGRILYCTCSLTLEENEMVVSSFLRRHPLFETRPILREFGSRALRGMSDCRRFYPHRDRTAGYFVARLELST